MNQGLGNLYIPGYLNYYHNESLFFGQGGYKLWKKMSFFVAAPAIALGMLNAYLAHQEGHHERPEFVAYEHLRIRTKVKTILFTFYCLKFDDATQGLTLPSFYKISF